MTEEDILNAAASGSGWTKSLEKLPSFSHEKLMNKLVRNRGTMPDKMAPKAYRNMKKGYGLWKEGYVRNFLSRLMFRLTSCYFWSKLVLVLQ